MQSETNEGMKAVTNLPQKLYLNLGLEYLADDESLDFKTFDHELVTWCEDKIGEGDPCYYHESIVDDLKQKLTSRLQTDKQVEEIMNIIDRFRTGRADIQMTDECNNDLRTALTKLFQK